METMLLRDARAATDERLLIGALITGTSKDSRTCRRAIELFGPGHDLGLIVVRGRIDTNGCAAAGVDLRALRHEVDMANRCRARQLSEREGLEGRCAVAMVDRPSPGSCLRAAEALRCDVLLIPERGTRLLRRAFARAARQTQVEVLAVA
jgi:hypothetical protein